MWWGKLGINWLRRRVEPPTPDTEYYILSRSYINIDERSFAEENSMLSKVTSEACGRMS